MKTKADAAIGGAWVCAEPSDDDLAANQIDPHCATTAADGTWALGGLFPGRWSVSAGADGKIPIAWRGDRRGVALHAGEARTGIDLVLADGGVLVTGKVEDLTGGPIVGARVAIHGDTSGLCLTRSDAAGVFRCWVPPGPSDVRATADGYTEGFAMIEPPQEGVELLLTPESTLDGKVVLAGTDEPVVGAWVGAPSGELPGKRASAITDDTGHFHLAHLPPGRYKPTATAPSLYGEAAESELVGLAQSRDGLVIEMHPVASVHGVVTLAGKPADDCSVEISAKAAHYDERTDADGVVTFDAVQPGDYHVRIQCSKEASKPPYADVVVADHSVEATWEVNAGATLTGIVVDDTGAPVANVMVSAASKGGNGEASTDTDGRFTLDGLAPGPAHMMIYSTDHFPPDPPPEFEIGKDQDVRIVVGTGGEISGTVVTASGAPVAGVEIQPAGTDGPYHVSDLNLATTREDGSFTLRGVRPGNYRVMAMRDFRPLRRPGATDDDKQGEPVTVAVDKPATVRILVEDESGQITGKVLDATGAPVGDAFLRAERESDAAGARQAGALASAHFGWLKKPSITATDGRFTIDGLTPGNYTVLAYREGGSEAEQSGVAVGASVTLTIARGGSLSGIVTSPNGPPRDVAITVVDKQTGFERDENFYFGGGQWAFRDLPPGRYDIVATTADGKGRLEGITLGEGEDHSGLELALAARVEVTGHLVDADTHAPIVGAHVVLSPADDPFQVGMHDMSSSAQPSDADGRFDVQNVPVGKVELMAMSRHGQNDFGYMMSRHRVDVEGTGPVDVGVIALHKARISMGTREGDLGFKLGHGSSGDDPTSIALTVASIEKGGPAAASGLQVGDVIVSVDGNDVRGDNAEDYYVLTTVPEGTTVSFTLARGATVKITAGKAPT